MQRVLNEEGMRLAGHKGTLMCVGGVQISESQKGVGENHAVSGLKFRILKKFLQLGYAVLLSDVDIVTLQNPFNFMYRDSDVESMSDGWDNATAYGAGPCPCRPPSFYVAGILCVRRM